MLKRPNGAPVRVVEVDEQHHIQGFHIDRGERRVLSLLGVSYWRKEDVYKRQASSCSLNTLSGICHILRSSRHCIHSFKKTEVRAAS